MALLNTLIEQLRNLWNQWSTSQRVGIVSATVACVAVIAGTLFWATRADYVVLANQLTPQRAAEIVGILETEQIDAELNFSGSAVSVARSDVSRARLALKDVWEPAAENETGISGTFPGSPSEEADRRRRQLETRISRSITQIRGIRSATVHISLPDPSPFVSEQVPATASIVVDPASPAAVTPSVAESVISLVARAVEGLAPEQISLMDTSGRQFNIADGIGSSMDGQFEYQQRVELRLAAKAESMLAMLLGHDKAVVRVSADISFTETTRTDRRFDPDGKVKRQETIETVSHTGGATAEGDVGVAANILPANYEPGAEAASYKKEVISADFDNPTTEEVTRDIPGKITRLTVAAIVDLNSPVDAADTGAGDASASPVPAIDSAQIEAIVKQAVGFDESRGDEIQVMAASLAHSVPATESAGFLTVWDRYEPVIQTVGMGLIAFTAFVMGFLFLRRMKPMVVTGPTGQEQLSLDEVRWLTSLSDEAKNNPDAAAKVLSAWLGADTSDESEDNSTETRAA